jgi:hypothetical protein
LAVLVQKLSPVAQVPCPVTHVPREQIRPLPGQSVTHCPLLQQPLFGQLATHVPSLQQLPLGQLLTH